MEAEERFVTYSQVPCNDTVIVKQEIGKVNAMWYPDEIVKQKRGHKVKIKEYE